MRSRREASTTLPVFRRILPASCLLLVACGSPSSPVVSPNGSEPAAKARAKQGETLGAALPAYELARVEPGTYGPVSIALDAGTLAVWAAPRERGRTWYSRAIERDGSAPRGARVIAETGLELGLVSLSPIAQGLRGLLVYSLQPAEQSTSVHALLLDSSGAPKSSATLLAQFNSSLLWTQVVDTGVGPMVFYAVARGDRAEVRAVGLTPEGKIRFVDREVVRDLRAWQIIAAPDGATLAVIRAPTQTTGGTVSLYLLDQQGAISTGPIDLEPQTASEADLDLTRVGKNYVVAWSNRTRIDSRIQIAAVDPSGAILTAARPAVAPLGDQVLVKLVPPANQGRAVLVWENTSLPFQRRMVSLAEVDDHGNVQSKVVDLACSSRSNTLPEIVATANGISALTFYDADESAAANTPDPMPTYVEFDSELVPRAAVPLLLDAKHGKSAIPLLAWGLECRHGCRTTGALDDTPVTIANIPLGDAAKRPNAQELARRITLVQTTNGIHLEKLESIAEIEPIADLAAVRSKDGFLMASVTYFDPSTPLTRLAKPGPDGRTDPLQARVDAWPFTPTNDAKPSPAAVSYRANSLSGLAMAAGTGKSTGFALAWSAIDQGQPQLFLSTLGDDGKKLVQRMLTHKRGRLDELAVAAQDDGWLLSWVDGRTEQPNLYALSVNNRLERRGTEQRLTNSRADVTDISLALVPGRSDAVLVYTVSRSVGRKGNVELDSRRISLRDAQPIGTEQHLLELAGPARFLSATRHQDGIVVSWVESAADADLEGRGAAVRWVRLDGNGAALTQPSSLRVGDAVPASVVVECPSAVCHGIVTLDVGGRGELQGFVFDPRNAEPPQTIPLARSLGTAEQNVAPILSGEHVFMVDQLDAERSRIVHAQVKWE